MATKTAEVPAKPTTKIYELIKSGHRATFFQTLADGSKLPVENHDDYTPHMVYTFTDKNGDSKTIRFLKAANTIYLDEQIKAGFPANLKIGEADRAELRFKGSKLHTNKKNVIAFFENCPANEAFEGDRGEYHVIFREFKPEISRKRNSDLAVRQAECIIALQKMKEVEMDNKLLKINGSAYKLPTGENAVDEKKELILDLINELDYDSLAVLLEKEEKDPVEVIIGKAINQGILSFIHAPGEISIKRSTGEFVKLMAISEDHSEDQKIQIFIDSLRTEEGKITLDAITEAIK